MVRTPSFDKNGIKKGAWSSEEDEILRAHILKYGHGNWRELPRIAGLKRCGKSCRLRWMNYLRPDLKHGNYTKAEEDLILRLHEQHGNKWAMIASKLDGRSDNEIKNHWHTHLKKRVIRPQKPANNNNKNQKPSIDDHIAESDTSRKKSIVLCGDHIQILESCPLSSSEELAPSSTTTSTCDFSLSPRFSPFEISTSSLDDGGLEEMLNSSELFAPLISPYDGESVAQETLITIDNVRRELLEEDELRSLEELLSPYPSYFDESFFYGLSFDCEQMKML